MQAARDPVQNDALAKAIADRVRAARAGAGLSQSEVARRTGIQRESISRLERGVHVPTIEVLRRVAGAIGCDASSFLPPS